jgi:hypothetical protein
MRQIRGSREWLSFHLLGTEGREMQGRGKKRNDAKRDLTPYPSFNESHSLKSMQMAAKNAAAKAPELQRS